MPSQKQYDQTSSNQFEIESAEATLTSIVKNIDEPLVGSEPE